MTPSIKSRDVLLLQIPLDVRARAVQWHADIMREFALITIGEDSATPPDDAGVDVTVPTRLLNVVAELRGKYATLTASSAQELEEAHQRGEVAADVTYTLPIDAAEDVRRFGQLLDEVDEFCRSGDLLTLAAQPEVAAFRRWFLGEFARQLGGAEPTPWPGWTGSHP